MAKPQTDPNNSASQPSVLKQAGVVAALIAAGTAILLWYLNRPTVPPAPEEATYHFSVKESGSTSKPIHGAKVTLTITATKVQVPPKVDETDSNGSVLFKVPRSNFNTLGKVSVQAKGYDSLDENVAVGSSDTLVTVMLTPTAAVPPPPPTLEPYSRTIALGPVPSGSAYNFSAPYSITSEPPKDGYKIVSASYSLSGDRACNAWSTCRWRENGESRVVFEFTLQGHAEWSSPGQGLSTGTLVVSYGPK